jgi:polyhydroxyalkanoate synthase
LPLFLDMVRAVAEQDPDMAAQALAGLRAFADAPEPPPRKLRPAAHTHGGASLRDCGGSGVPVVLVPSLINPPDILDLGPDRSLAGALAASGARVLLLDWGPAAERSALDLGQHVSSVLEPLLRKLGEPVALLGYCLGGTLALAAASRVPVRRVATMAAPWRFAAYPAEARTGFAKLLNAAAPVARLMGVLPMEVLQSAFWSLDPRAVVSKYARFARDDPASPDARDFVVLESWANGGEPLPWPAALELADALFTQDQTALGTWCIRGVPVSATPGVPVLHLVAGADRITPPGAGPPGERWTLETGHIGLAIGGTARAQLYPRLFNWLTSPANEG